MKARILSSTASILGAAFLLALGAGQVLADDFPSKDVRYLLHASPGGGTDVMARTLAPEVEKALGKPLVVENRPGGGGAVQMTNVTRAKPDGYTIGATTGSLIGRMNTALKGQFNIDDFDWISGLLSEPMIFVVHTGTDIDTLKEMVEKITANPGKYKVASFAIGSAQHIAWNIFAEGAGFDANDAVWVPYDSIGEAATATLGKHAEICVCFVTQVRDHVRAGNLRILAVMSDQAPGPFPDVPTVHQAGYPDVELGWVQFRGIVGPKGIPEERKQKIHEAFMKSLDSERVQKWMETNALDPMGYGPKEFTQFVKRYNELAAAWVERLGVGK